MGNSQSSRKSSSSSSTSDLTNIGKSSENRRPSMLSKVKGALTDDRYQSRELPEEYRAALENHKGPPIRIFGGGSANHPSGQAARAFAGDMF